MARKAATKKTSASSAAKRAVAKKPVAKAAASKKAPKKAAKAAPVKKAAPAPVVKPKVVVKATKATKPKNDSSLSYTQSEFIENLRAFCGFDKRGQAKEVWDDVSNFIMDALKRGYRVPLVNLGKMYVRKSKSRMGRNPATGEIIHIAAKKRVRFTASKTLKDSVL